MSIPDGGDKLQVGIEAQYAHFSRKDLERRIGVIMVVLSGEAGSLEVDDEQLLSQMRAGWLDPDIADEEHDDPRIQIADAHLFKAREPDQKERAQVELQLSEWLVHYEHMRDAATD